MQRVSANLTFWPTEFSRIRLQGAATLPGGGLDTEWSVLTAFEFAVGAHGAHAFLSQNPSRASCWLGRDAHATPLGEVRWKA